MFRKLIPIVVVLLVVGVGVITSVKAQQQYYQPIYSHQPTYSQYSTYESIPQVVYPGNAVTYQSAPVYSNPAPQYYSPTYASAPVYSTPVFSNQVQSSNQVYESYPSGTSTVVGQVYAQPAYAEPVYSQPLYSQPTYTNSYPSTYTNTSNYSTPVTYGTQVYPTQTYASSNYAPQSYPATQAYVPGTYTSSQVVQSPQTYTASYSPGGQYTSTSVSPGLAQQKAQQAAQMGLRAHVGGGLGGAKAEGVGWSNQSPQEAIQKCCYWGQRPTAQIGVSKSHDGCWYACVLYY